MKTLLDFALGSIILYFVFNYYNYWIQNQFFTTEKPDDDDVKKSFIFVVVSCLLLLISNVSGWNFDNLIIRPNESTTSITSMRSQYLSYLLS